MNASIYNYFQSNLHKNNNTYIKMFGPILFQRNITSIISQTNVNQYFNDENIIYIYMFVYELWPIINYTKN